MVDGQMRSDAAIAVETVPALAAAIRSLGRHRFVPVSPSQLSCQELVPVYQVRDSSVDTEIEDAVRLVELVTDRLRRLAAAYGEWHDFDAGAYFDLTDEQLGHLVKVTERVSTVHVLFRTDLLLPAFQRATAFWVGQFSAAHAAFLADYGGAASQRSYDDDFLLDVQPAMVDRWQQLLDVVQSVRYSLADDPGYIGMSATSEVQMDVRLRWAKRPARGVITALTPALQAVPTLALSYDFSLPAHRQSGRLRRLRRNRKRRQTLYGSNEPWQK